MFAVYFQLQLSVRWAHFHSRGLGGQEGHSKDAWLTVSKHTSLFLLSHSCFILNFCLSSRENVDSITTTIYFCLVERKHEMLATWLCYNAVIFVSDKLTLMINCISYYRYSFGWVFFVFKGSYLGRRWIHAQCLKKLSFYIGKQAKRTLDLDTAMAVELVH